MADESKQVAEQVKLQREQAELNLRAYVYPSTPAGWASGRADWQDRRLGVLPLKNGGPGIALNVEGKAFWRNPGEGESWTSVSLYAGSIAPSDEAEARASNTVGTWQGCIGT